jgi:Flp pilus assembly protein TadG
MSVNRRTRSNSRQTLLSSQSRNRSRKGAVMLWFVLIQLPVLFFALGMTVDFTRIYIAHRQVANASQAAAQAGAQQISPTLSAAGTPVLNQPAAQSVAIDTINRAEGANAIRTASSNPLVTVTTTATTITVKMTYQPSNLMFANIFSTPTTTVTSTAFICVPGQSGATQGYCATPGA